MLSSEPLASYSGNIKIIDKKNHWSQTAITNIIIMEKFETFLELSKYDTEIKWENTVGKITPADLLNAGLPQIFDLLKKKRGSICKMQYPAKHNEVKYHKMRYTCVIGNTIMR